MLSRPILITVLVFGSVELALCVETPEVRISDVETNEQNVPDPSKRPGPTISSGDLARTRNAVTAVRAAVPPQIDGRLDDSSWKDAPSISGFISVSGKPDIAEQTQVKVLYDDNGLYFGFELFDSRPGKLRATVTEHDGGVWEDDCIEIFLDPSNQRRSYCHFLVTSRGIRGDEYYRQVQKGARAKELAWDPDWQAATTIGDISWFVEAAIPFHVLEINERVDSKWAINFTRHQISKNELSCLFSTHGNFHRPEKFGELLGLEADLAPYRYRLADFDFGQKIVGDNELSFHLTNESGSPRELLLQVDLTHPTGERVTETKRVSLRNSETRKIDVPYRLKGRGEQTVQISLIDPKTKAIYHAAPRQRFTPPPPMVLKLTRPHYANSIFADQDIKAITAKVSLAVEANVYGQGRLKAELRAKADLISTTVLNNLATENEISLDAGELETGNYEIRVSLLDTDGATLAEASQDLHKLPPAPAGSEVRIDGDNRIIVDGEPFFPIGIWWPDESDRVFREISEAGFNTVMIRYAFVWRPAEESRRLVEKLEQHGLKLVDRGTSASSVSNVESLRNYISNTKQYSPLIAWFSSDEPDSDEAEIRRKRGPLAQRRSVIRKEDPYHLVYVNMMHPGSAGAFAAATDVTGFDYYPCYERDGECMAPMGSYAGKMQQAIASVNNEQPIWLIAQLHPHLRYATGFHHRPDRIPNFTEQRCVVYQSIVHGAKGIFWFVYEFLGTDKITDHPGEWYALRALATEMAALSPVFLSPDSELDVMLPPKDDDVHLMLKDHAGDLYLFAVSTSRGPKTLTVNIPGLKDKKILRVISENRQIELSNGHFQDSFEKYGVHIYTTSRELPKLMTVAEIEGERQRLQSEHQ